MNAQEVIERLLVDNPQLHYLTEDDIRLSQEALRSVGFKLKAGPISMAVPEDILRYLADKVQSDHLTLETGAGHTTVVFAALAKQHICITPSKKEVELIKNYMYRVGIPTDKVSFIIEPSDTALSHLSMPDKLDFAYVDGCHGYPFPALDWHFIDLHMKVGGIIGFDNTEIRAVQNHCAFLDENKSYRVIDSFSFPNALYGASFFRKLHDQLREWIFQPYNARRILYQHPPGIPHVRHEEGQWVPWTRNPILAFKRKWRKFFTPRH